MQIMLHRQVITSYAAQDIYNIHYSDKISYKAKMCPKSLSLTDIEPWDTFLYYTGLFHPINTLLYLL